MNKAQAEIKPIERVCLEAATQLPGAWYDLSARISNARAVVDCIQESLPTLENMNDRQRAAINHASGLAGALDDVLCLCVEDLNLMEQQFFAQTKPA
jgi:hypothetical protein